MKITNFEGADFSHAHVISLVDPRTELEQKHAGHRIYRFDDVEGEHPAYVAPTLQICEAILYEGPTPGLVHCMAGVSRSTATAIACLVRDGMPPKDAVLYVESIRPVLAPNRLMTAHFSEILGINISYAVQELWDSFAYTNLMQKASLWKN